ncbi:sulfatase family protein [Novipirellula artificiosorum]|uniref:Arylsulfatase n=1 Tax=Novipirellula artificiosorum TaxID=2528016 RepID=A0A5C6DZQ5_9BACT|nr:sulfatase [Novipirellula artificiosorum]TWU40546.1 Arylsulfatase precursor [Novipirellula artificiosorum]
MKLDNRMALIVAWICIGAAVSVAARPNILIAIADDQSYPHASAYGTAAIQTPAFDQVAKSGILFRNAFTPAPGCSPMRAAFLTGREIWQIREAGTHASYFPPDLPVFTDQLSDHGYHVGMTGKGWSPGSARGWPHNPAGKAYSDRKMETPTGIRNTDYAANFSDFLKERPSGQPFCFWFGCSEPHRDYDRGIGKRNGIDPDQIELPGFLPDSDEVRSDVADYMFEIEWFDSHLQRMLDELQRAGELDNTLVIVTSDNGMPFPRAKANLYEYGIHMPLAISWPAMIPAGQDNDDLVSLIDVTQTIFHAAEVAPKQADQMPGRSLLGHYSNLSDEIASPRDGVFSGRERHSSSRFRSLGYPCRCIRTKTHLYIRNFTPERWPAGAAQKFDKAKYDGDGNLIQSQLGDALGGFHDIDNGPTLQWMIANRDQTNVAQLLAAAVDLRPSEELYDIQRDPACLENLSEEPSAKEIKADLASRLTEYLTQTGDLRQTDPKAANVWETYPRLSSLRWFPIPDWARDHPDLVPQQDWLEKRRPR